MALFRELQGPCTGTLELRHTTSKGPRPLTRRRVRRAAPESFAPVCSMGPRRLLERTSEPFRSDVPAF